MIMKEIVLHLYKCTFSDGIVIKSETLNFMFFKHRKGQNLLYGVPNGLENFINISFNLL
jgi:hypothetical protein